MVDADIHFGTDGWRGFIADDFTFSNLSRVSHAATAVFKSNSTLGTIPRIFIGYDRRFLSPQFAAFVAKEFTGQGLEVTLSQTAITTPAVSYIVKHRHFDWGISITASHNPALFNGFKVKDRHGRSAPPEITTAIEKALPISIPISSPQQDPENTLNIHSSYVSYLKSHFKVSKSSTLKKSIVLDHLYGVASGIPEAVIGNFFKIASLHAEHDPLFGGLHPEPIANYVTALQKTVRQTRALVGFAYDGDADRLGVVDDTGTYLTPHQVFPLITLYGIEQRHWKGKIVQSVSMGVLGERIAKAFGMPYEDVPVGFKHIANRILKEPVLAGGEESGGYAFYGGLPERDGILNSLLFLEMLHVTQEKPSVLVKSMEKRFGKVCFHRVDVHLKKSIPNQRDFLQQMQNQIPNHICGKSIERVNTLDGLKIHFSNGSWLLLRPSGTEPLLRTYAESESWKQTHSLLKWAEQWVEQFL